MEEKQNTDKIADKRLKNLRPPWKKGEKVKGAGHPKGQRNYATIRAEAIISIGKANNKTPNEIEEMLVSKGVAEALKGDFRFYKDDLDRTHGQALQKQEIKADVNISIESQKITDEAIADYLAKVNVKNTPTDITG